jgi:AcrR family transcriptional regulator
VTARATDAQVQKRAGRPRREGLDEAILAAALDELGRVGFSRMNLEQIARIAGTTKPTIYARYSSKAKLAAAALESLRRGTPRARTGDVRHDLIEELSLFRKGALRANGISMLGSVLAEQHEHPELLRQFRRHIAEPRHENLRRILRAGIADGQLRADVDVEIAITMLIGSLHAAYIAGMPINRDWPKRVTDEWLRENAA